MMLKLLKRWALSAVAGAAASFGCGSRMVTPPVPCSLPIVRFDAADSTFRLVSMREPVYPDEAMQQGHQGTVLVRTVVDYDGSLCEWAVASTSGYVELDKSATDAVGTARFTAARRGGRPIRVEVIVPIEFRLHPMEAECGHAPFRARPILGTSEAVTA